MAHQLGYYLTRNINQWKNPDHSWCVFTENTTPHCLLPKFACMNIAEAFGFSGPLIATSLVTAAKLVTYPCCKQKYFYVWNLEWTMGQQRVHSFYKSIYGNESLKLIARNEYHAKAIRNCWNRDPVGCVDDFNMDELVKLL